MILTAKFLQVPLKENFTKLFTVSIQLGAILSVLVLYWKKFITPLQNWKKGLNYYLKLMIGVLPALVLGYLFDEKIESLLESPLTVSISLFAGGFILLFVDKLFRNHHIIEEKKISYLTAVYIGFWQCIAMIPGISRSAASIIGGMQQRLSRSLAAEFSFFLAVPTMAAATGYSLFLKDWKEGSVKMKGYELIQSSTLNTQVFLIGNIVAFIVALLAIKFFIHFLQKHGFRLFGWYRIGLGALLLLLIWLGYL